MAMFLKKYRLFLIAIVLFLFLRVPSLYEPYWYGDEGIYLTIGQALRSGSVLFRQIHDNKPPTLYYLAAIGQTVFGFRLLLIVFMAATNVVFYRLAKKYLKKNALLVSFFLFLILSSIPLIEGNIANAEVFMLFPTILGVFLFISASERQASSYLFLVVGLLLGFAFTIKVPVAVEFGFLCLWLFVFNLKKIRFLVFNLLFLVIGFLLPIILWATYFAVNKAFSEFIFAALLQNFGYLSSWATGTHSGSATSSGLVTRAIFLLIVWIILYILHLRRRISKSSLLILGWFAATIFGSLLSSRPYPHYLIQTLPPLCLLIGLLFQKKYLALFPVFIFAIILVKYRFYYYEPFTYYLNYYSYVFKLKNTTQYNSHFSQNLESVYQVADFIKSRTSKTDKIFVWGDEPYLYPLSDRLPATKYTVAYHIVDFRQYDFVYNQLATIFPKIVVYYPMANRPYPQLDNLLHRFYSPVAQIGTAIIFQNNLTLP